MKNIVPLLKKKFALNSNNNNNKIIQSINSIETYAYVTSKHLLCKKEETKSNNIIKQLEKY